MLWTLMAACTRPSSAEDTIPIDMHRSQTVEGLPAVSRQFLETATETVNSIFEGFGYEFQVDEIRDVEFEELADGEIVYPKAETRTIGKKVDLSADLDLAVVDAHLIDGRDNEELGGYCPPGKNTHVVATTDDLNGNLLYNSQFK